jgi:putative CRISPR-associated protein (TIGR02620 family)
MTPQGQILTMEKIMTKVIITRHQGLIPLLIEMGLATNDTTVLSHATADDVAGKDVIGVLPLWLAAQANSVTEVTLNIPADMRGVELDVDQCRAYMTGVSTYVVNKA